MPIFEFTCPDCGNSFEELLRNSDAVAEVICPACQSTRVRRKISSFASKITNLGQSSLQAASSCAPGGT